MSAYLHACSCNHTRHQQSKDPSDKLPLQAEPQSSQDPEDTQLFDVQTVVVDDDVVDGVDGDHGDN